MDIAISIQDIWLIEEKAMSLRSFITFSPPKAPIKDDIKAIKVIIDVKIGVKVKYEIKYIGAIFWIERRTKAWGQDSPSMTWGNQKWTGAAPSLIMSDSKIRE